MGIVVETGAIVPGANSFVTKDQVTAYAVERGLAWDPDADGSDGAVVEAGDYLRNEQRYVYRGTRVSYLQTMPFPRTGASEYRGPEFPDTYIPWRVMDAQCQLAVRAQAAGPGKLQQDLARGGQVKTEKVDAIEVTYMDTASPETVLTAVQGLLQPLLLSASFIPATPYQATPDEHPEFEADTFANPVSGSDLLT